MRHVLIIGAGPAGCVAAIKLARDGVDVTLVEQHRFPRDKVCGECLSATGIEVLDRLNLARGLVRKLHPVELTRTFLFCSDGTCAHVPLPKTMWGISRLVLDPFLLECARDAGATILQPARCESIAATSARLRMLDTNQVQDISADHILIADGKPPRDTAVSAVRATHTGDLGLKAHFKNIDASRDAIELFGVDGHYGGIAPIENGLWNIAFSVPSARIARHKRNFDSLFAEIVSENKALSDQMRHAKRVSEWLVSPLPRFGPSRGWKKGIIPIGNSAAAMEPIGGEGMGLAMQSAEMAADVILESIRNDARVNVTQLQKDYRALWNRRRLFCRLGAKIISSPTLSRLAVPFARGGSDGPGAWALRLVGK